MFRFIVKSDHDQMPLEIDQASLCSLDCIDFGSSVGSLFRSTLGITFVKGLEKIPDDRVLARASANVIAMKLQGVIAYLNTYRDVLEWKYQYEFLARPGLNEGAESGFRVNGLYGHITTRPTGYCTLRLSEIAPNGMGRIVEVIDMRIKKEIQTETLGMLKIRRRKFNNKIFDFVDNLNRFLVKHGEEEITFLLA